MEVIIDKFYLMEKRSESLPDINTMYDTIRQNKDYNVVKVYHGPHTRPTNTKPTKNITYLDQSLRLECSPGPASNLIDTQTQPTK